MRRDRDGGSRGTLVHVAAMLIADGVGMSNSATLSWTENGRRVACCINRNLVGRIMQESRALMAAAALGLIKFYYK